MGTSPNQPLNRTGMGWGARSDGGGRCPAWSLPPSPADTLQTWAKSLSFVWEKQLPSLGTGGTWLGAIPSQPPPGNTGMERMGWHSTTLHVLPQGGELKASCGFCLQPSLWGHHALSSVVLPWGQPETPPGWHMLVSEGRTEG